MPFLVDSLTMALERHDLGIHLVVHPIVRVRRDADGALLGIVPRPTRRRIDAVRSSRGRTSRSTARPIRRCSTRCAPISNGCCATCAPRRATGSRCWRALARVVDELDAHTAADRRPTSSPRARRCCTGSSTSTSRSSATAATTCPRRRHDCCPVPGTGLGLLRNAPEAPSRELCRRCPSRSAPRRASSTLLVLTKANRALDGAPADLPRLRRRQALRRRTATSSASTVSSASTRRPRTRGSPSEVPVLRRKVAAVIERAGFLPASHDQKDLVADPRDLSARRPVPDRRRHACTRPRWAILRLQERRRVRLFVYREPYGRFVSCLVFLPRDRYTTQVRDAHRRSSSSTRSARSSHEWNARPRRESVLARLHFVLHVDPTAAARRRRRRARTPGRGGTRAWVDDLRDALVARTRRGRRARSARTSGATRSRRRTTTTSTRPKRSPTSSQLERSRRTAPLAVRLVGDRRPPRPQALRPRSRNRRCRRCSPA